jgi:hypothetical protein
LAGGAESHFIINFFSHSYLIRNRLQVCKLPCHQAGGAQGFRRWWGAGVLNVSSARNSEFGCRRRRPLTCGLCHLAFRLRCHLRASPALQLCRGCDTLSSTGRGCVVQPSGSDSCVRHCASLDGHRCGGRPMLRSAVWARRDGVTCAA